MTLSLLRSRELSWQDRTLTMESMLSPHRSRLMFNKHKSLNTWCNNEVDLYEKQATFLVKDIAVEKRLMERYSSKLESRRKELVVQRCQSAQEMRKVELLTLKERSRSAPVCRGSSPPRHEGRRSRGLFLTEIEDDYRTSKLSKNKRLPKNFQRAPTHFKRYRPKLPEPTTTSVVFKRKTYVTFGVRAPSVSTESETSSVSESEEEPEVEVKEEHPLDVKIKNFLDEVKSFNEKPASLKRCPGSRDLFAYLKENEKGSDVVKKYSSVTTDRQRLEAAFKSFCKTKSREDLVKMMRLAAKMKANAAQSRNTNPVLSVVPVVAALRSSRMFLSLRDRVKQNVDDSD